MDGWIVAFILYPIPVLVGMVSAKDYSVRDPYFIEVIFWPAFMLIGSVILWFQSRKR